MSLTIQNKVETTGLTAFESEACEATEVLAKHWHKPTTAPLQPDIQNLTDYFARPRLIGSGTFNTGQATQFSQSVDNFTVFNSLFPGGVTRLTGVQGVRYKLCFTIQVATTPFHQGVLACSWQYGLTTGAASNLTGLTPRGFVLGMQTNIPHVRIDVATTTMATLSVPWLSTYEYQNITSTVQYGLFTITPLLPVTSGTGTAAPTYRLYLHLEDMELIGAIAPDTSTITLQSGKKSSPVVEEFNKDSHPFSSALNSAGQVFSFVAKGVPSLASLAGPPAWLLGQAARLVRFYGYSKPALMEPPQRMFPQSNINESHVDLPSCTNQVGPFQGNTLAVSPEFVHTTVDEMSLAFITSQYSQICIGSMAQTHASGTALYVSPVSPGAFWFRSRLTGSPPYCNINAPLSAPASTVSFIPSNIFYVASCFRYWKGSFRFRITFAKTKFHGGRVLLYYTPVITSAPGSPTDALPSASTLTAGVYGPQPFGYSKLFDLRDGNVVEFDVPYINTTPYQSFFNNVGSISMYVQDPLISPATVPSVVPFLVEVKALDDFEVANPVSPLYPPVNTTDIAPGIRYQSGKLATLAKDDDCALCIGERVTSVKQLITLPKYTYVGSLAANAADTFYVYPWWFGNRINSGTTLVLNWPAETFGFGNYFAQGYVFCRGSTEGHVYASNFANHKVYIAASVPSVNGGAVAGIPGLPINAPYSSTPRIVQVDTDYGLHFRTPAYQKVARFLTSALSTLTWSPVTTAGAARTTPIPSIEDSPYVVAKISVLTTTNVATQIRLSRAAGDDAALGHYIGPPLLGLIGPLTASTVYDPESTANL